MNMEENNTELEETSDSKNAQKAVPAGPADSDVTGEGSSAGKAKPPALSGSPEEGSGPSPTDPTDKEARRQVMRIAWPVLLELFMSSLFGMVDMIMLGNIRPISLSAASIA